MVGWRENNTKIPNQEIQEIFRKSVKNWFHETLQEWNRAAVFEVKHSEKMAELETDCEKALSQIQEKGYAETLKEDYMQVVCYGVACYKKRCLLKVLSVNKIIDNQS